MKSNNRALLLGSTALVGALVAFTAPAQAQMYSTGPGFYLSLEGRYIFNKGDNSNLRSTPSPSIIGELFDADDGPNLKARPDNGWGGKAMLGYRFNNNWDIALGFAGNWLKNGKKTFSYTASDESNSSALKTKLDYQVADFEAGYNMTMGQNSNLRLFGGIRFAHFNQTAKGSASNYECFSGVIGDCGSSSTAFASGKRKTTYWGIGPRIGANGSFGLGNSGFNVFGGLAGALLIGKFKDSLNMYGHNTTTEGGTSTTRVTGKKKKTKLVPNLEGEIGLGYNFNAGGGSTVGLQLGYRAEKWWGVTSDAKVLESSFSSHTSDQFMHGPFVRLVATFGSAAPAPMASPPPPPPPARTAKSFIVFFDFDRSNITAQAQATINDAVAAAKAGNSTRITLTGHTDRSGSEQYNQALSVRRGEAVKAAMIRGGIPANAIVVIGRGESQPLVQTPDGVREPQNRRVEIVI
jgi:outer membrane protein OmpA-like peptidoglycan-associated protein